MEFIRKNTIPAAAAVIVAAARTPSIAIQNSNTTEEGRCIYNAPLERRKRGENKHRFWGWAMLLCAAMAVWTGYRHK